MSKEMLFNHLYEGEGGLKPEIKIVDVLVCQLRQKLTEEGGDSDYIQTVWGRGYKFSDPNGSNGLANIQPLIRVAVIFYSASTRQKVFWLFAPHRFLTHSASR
jgi:hypothetical protein